MQETIQIIDNRNNRNNSLLSLFTHLNDNRYGKLVDNWYFIINTTMYLSHNSSKEDITFNLLQQKSNSRGIVYNMFLIDSYA